MSSQPIDYAAIAARYNSVGSSAPPANNPVDYAAIAKRYDSVGSTPAPKGNLGSLQTLDSDQPGMQPAVDGLAPRDVSAKAAETLDYLWQGIHNGAHAIPQMLDALHEGTPSHEIEKRGIIKGSIELIKKGFEQLNPVAPDRGQGPLNRTAETVGNVAGAAATPMPEDVAGISKSAVDTAKVAPQAVNAKYLAAKEAFEAKRAIPPEKALDAALPAKSGVNVGGTLATPEVVQRIRETAAKNGLTEPSADNLKAAVDKVVEENRAEFHKYLDPVKQLPAQLPNMPTPVLNRLIANIELTNPDVAARMKAKAIEIGDLDVIRQRINQDTKFPPTGSSETAMNSALKFAGAKIRDKLYPLVERLNTLPEGSLADLKKEEGTFTELQPLADKYAAQISKYASKEETKGMLEKVSGGARGAMGGAIGGSIGTTAGMALFGPEGAALGGSAGTLVGRFVASREGKVAESKRLMRAVFGK